MKKNVDLKKTLAYAVTFYFIGSLHEYRFMINNKVYKYVKTVFDTDEKGFSITLVVVQNLKTLKYEVLKTSDPQIAEKEVTIL